MESFNILGSHQKDQLSPHNKRSFSSRVTLAILRSFSPSSPKKKRHVLCVDKFSSSNTVIVFAAGIYCACNLCLPRRGALTGLNIRYCYLKQTTTN
ncbi:hypothetical protein NC651_017176 [Populus alba x Populus x berolinensis]|nr:hypothetical protein NC651_017176 [Populus alba x Populus x berolinensis]